MSAQMFTTLDPVRLGEILVRTQTGTRLHIPGCPHLEGAFREARAEERLAIPICQWSQAEIAGVGRTYFDLLEDAMRAFGTHVGTHRLIRDALRFVTYDQIWTPNSRSYIALGHQGRGVAWFGKGWVVPAMNVYLALPGHREGSGGGAAHQERVGGTCPQHHLTRSVTGLCDLCD